MDDRRDEFADAALRLIAREGIDAVSFRNVAAEAGWSAGLVQKAFASKDELLAATLCRAQQQVGEGAGASFGTAPPREWLLELLMAMMPLDDERRASVLIDVGFAARAPYEPAIAARLAETNRAIRDRLAAGIRAQGLAGTGMPLDADLGGQSPSPRGVNAGASGGDSGAPEEEAAPDAATEAATALIALADGLARQLLLDALPEPRVRAILARGLDSALPAP